jgi:hypothetical protein
MRRLLALALAAGLLLAALPAGPAAAHGQREVGPYQFTIGFGAEPAYAGIPNSVQVLVERGGKPVTDADGMLQVRIQVNANGTAYTSKPYRLDPNFGEGWGEQGDYRADFTPTLAAAYTFRVTGQLPDENIDIAMTSGSEETFGSPRAIGADAVPPVPDVRAAQVQMDADVAAVQAQADRQAWLLAIVGGLALLLAATSAAQLLALRARRAR